jgi:predicted transcriptional regulator YdeE
MKKEKTKLGDLILVGLSARTKNIDEISPSTSKIANLAGKYWENQLANSIRHRTNPGITYAVYTDYESDETGEYTYFIGEQVDSINDQNLDDFNSHTIAESTYQKFTTGTGEMPGIIITSWQEIWTMTEQDFEGKRKYLADFEIYDERARDPSNIVVDIYIGIHD